MRHPRILALSVAAAVLSLASSALAETLTVRVDQPGAKINPNFYGLMTEEINYSYDGGLYAELISNRIFRNEIYVNKTGGKRLGHFPDGVPPPPAAPTVVDPKVIPHWSMSVNSSSSATISLDTSNPINTHALTTSLKLDASQIDSGERAGIANEGYWGIPVKPNTTYTASFYARAADFSGPLHVSINANRGNGELALATTENIGPTWKKYTVTLKTGPNVRPGSDNKFVITMEGKGTVWFNLVSLFPPTFNNRPNGNRIDLMQKLIDLKPKFLRFPGGNYLEGNDLANRFDWKKTIGPLEDRPGHLAPWGYRSSDGMGLLEFLQWAEDMNAEPVLGVFNGLTLQNGAVTGDALKPYVQEALEEIEYVIGDTSTRWGAERAKHGHPAPFKLNYVEIGNEDNLSGGTPTHDERFTAFYDAIRAKYPQLKIIASTAAGLRSRKPDAIDEHYYHANVQNALAVSKRWDNREQYPIDGPKIFVGEWATRLRSEQTPSLQAALADAAFLTGMERNPEIVIMAAYAPLFVNVNPGGMQWATDLIGYDANSSFGSVSYYAQKMFYTNVGTEALPYDLSPNPDIFVATSRDSATGEIILKLVSGREAAADMTINLAGVTSVERQAKGWILTGNIMDMNTITEPTKIVPKEITINNAAPKFNYRLPGNSLVVMRVKVK